MFRVLDRYLLANILLGTMIALLVLVALDAFFSFLNELDDVGKGTYDTTRAFYYILLTLPRRFYEFAPTATLLGGLLTLGALASHGELTAMRAAGLSVTGFATKVLTAGLMIVIVVLVIGEFLAPAAEQRGQLLRAEALSAQLGLAGGQGLWIRQQPWFVQAREIPSEEHLRHLRMFRFEGGRLRELVTADAAQRNSDGWLLQGVKRLRIEDEGVIRNDLETEQWPELVTRQMFEVLRVSPDQMSIRALAAYIDYLGQNGLDTARYRLAWWMRIVTPLSTLVMLVLALPFVFGSQRVGGAGQRLFIGIVLGISYFLISNLFNEIGVVYGLAPIVSVAVPPVLFATFALWRLRNI
ncbi:MAG: LPS export ABC transporter permease LptG [Thiotrichales bacterium]